MCVWICVSSWSSFQVKFSREIWKAAPPLLQVGFCDPRSKKPNMEFGFPAQRLNCNSLEPFHAVNMSKKTPLKRSDTLGKCYLICLNVKLLYLFMIYVLNVVI